MSSVKTGPSAPEGVSEGQENIPLRNNSPINNEEIAPPAYNPSSAIQQPTQIPNAQINGQESIAAPAAPPAAFTTTEGQALNPNSVSAYPAGAVVIPINPSQVKTVSNPQYPGNVSYIVTTTTATTQQHPNGAIQGHYAPSHHLGHQPPPPRPGQPHRHVVDDPSCLYILAIIAFFIPLVGLIAMCMYNCGNGLPPRQAGAFRILVLSTMVSILIAIIAGSV